MPRHSTERAILELDWNTASHVQANLTALHTTMLTKYNVSVRDDSRLAYNWALGVINAPIDEIMEELAFIQWISSHTNYQIICEDGLRSIANAIHDIYPNISWSNIWTIVRSYGPDLIKYMVVEKFSSGIPDLCSVTLQ